MDCAAKFEKDVAALPGVTGASLNIVTGKLTVEGLADLEAVRLVGRKEKYIVIPAGKELIHPAKPKVNGTVVRMVVAAAFLLAAIIAEQTVSAPAVPLYLLAILTGGWGNILKAAYSLPRRDINMSVLMTLAIMGAMAIGEWREGAALAFLYAVSELLESWNMERVRRSISALMDIVPKAARIRLPAGEARVPVEDIRAGDVMLVRPGERIAMDGRIIKGVSAINEAAVTGESVPLEKGPGAHVYAGTFNTYGYLEVEVTKLVKDTTIARIIQLVEEAQARRAPIQAFMDRFAAVYTPVVLALALCIVLAPPLLSGADWGPWVYRGLALMVVACPCALVVSTPAAIVSAIGNAARQGVLIKGGIYLEQAGALTAVAFDKTGTLTKGEPSVTDIIPLGPYSERELLQIAADLEVCSEHPLAGAVVRAATARGLQVEPAGEFCSLTGCGVRGMVNGQTVFISNIRLLSELGVAAGHAAGLLHRLQAEGKTALCVSTKESLLGIIAVADTVRENSAAVVAALQQAGIRRTIMLTGDNAATAQAIAARVGVNEYHADLLPQDKVQAVQALLQRYGKVAMVGDGINDAPALAASTVGIAMGGAGTDIALQTADIAFMADDLTKLPFTIRLSRKTLRIIRQNIGIALALKVIAVAAVFPGWLTLWLAIMGDMGATLLVTLNSMRLLRLNPDKQ